jgi:hypothetical protein
MYQSSFLIKTLFTSVILATQEADIGMIAVEGQPEEKMLDRPHFYQ